MVNKKKYKFEIFYDKKGKGIGCKLEDGTQIFITKKATLQLAFPKNKFKKIFEQEEKLGWKTYNVEFSFIEIQAILKALTYKKMIKKKENVTK